MQLKYLSLLFLFCLFIPYAKAGSTVSLFIGNITSPTGVVDVIKDTATDQQSAMILNENDLTSSITLQRWDDDVHLKVGYDMPILSTTVSDINFTYVGTDQDVQYNKLEPSAAFPDGGYELNVVLKTPPLTNTLTYTLDTKGLDFFYQPPLDQEEQPSKIYSCNATDCFNGNGELITHRPENVVGSYAAYYAAVTQNIENGKEYRTGKAFHIYRPYAVDTKGTTVWADLLIDITTNTFTIAIPQQFLDEAIYPVLVDPTFGYTSSGASNAGGTGPVLTNFTTNNEGGTITNISTNCNTYFGTTQSMGNAIYNTSGAALPDARLATDAGDVVITGTGWFTTNVSVNITANTVYWLGYFLNASSILGIAYDSSTAGNEQSRTDAFETWPDPFGTPTFSLARKVSIYATYIPFLNISFVQPTPANGSSQYSQSIYVNVSSTQTTNHSTILDFNNSLVGWWRFNNESGENGTFFKDWSTWGNNATCSGSMCPNFTSAGMRGKALDFVANNNISMGSPASLDDLHFKTVMFWLVHRNHSFAQTVIGKYLGTGGQSWDITIRGGADGAASNITRYSAYWSGSAGATAIWRGSTPLTDLQAWYHVAVVYNDTASGNAPVFYINGKLDTTTTVQAAAGTEGVDASGDLKIGTDGFGRYNNITVDDMQIYNRLLTAAEINASFNAQLYQYKQNFTALPIATYPMIAYAQYLDGTINQTDIRYINITLFNASCVKYSGSGNYALGCNCTIDAANDLLGNNFTFTGSGPGPLTVNISGGITNYTKGLLIGSCNVTVLSVGGIRR